ncbi:hypothetical protein Q8A67_023162 [Cirrhinus molitorella]|uniref:Uncharacterized protein n=1 Tax=Cirrhinus molitorella TaxID=172907 RepID=A0AA88T9Y8_9TELE|nr:hypothetical protein Q8A67_023162 [Cirrhinus molitorella]
MRPHSKWCVVGPESRQIPERQQQRSPTMPPLPPAADMCWANETNRQRLDGPFTGASELLKRVCNGTREPL